MARITTYAFIRGSHGTLKVHKETGVIVSRPEGCGCGECHNGYSNIARFDPMTFVGEPDATSFDILGCAYWTHDGTYEEMLTVRTITGPFKASDGRVYHADDDFDDWMPFRLLPAPGLYAVA